MQKSRHSWITGPHRNKTSHTGNVVKSGRSASAGLPVQKPETLASAKQSKSVLCLKQKDEIFETVPVTAQNPPGIIILLELILLPFLVSIVVVSYIVYGFLSTESGLINHALSDAGKNTLYT